MEQVGWSQGDVRLYLFDVGGVVGDVEGGGAGGSPYGEVFVAVSGRCPDGRTTAGTEYGGYVLREGGKSVQDLGLGGGNLEDRWVLPVQD